MSLIFPFLSIFGETAGKLFDKANLKFQRVSYQALTVIIFAVMLLLTVLYIIIARQPFPHLSLLDYLLLAVMIVISAFSNIFEIKGLSMQDLAVMEPFSNFEALLGGLAGFALFASERHVLVLVFVIIGSVALILSTQSHKHILLLSDRGMQYFLWTAILEAALLIVYKLALQHVPVAWVFFFRMAGVLVVVAFAMPFEIKSVTKSQWRLIILAGVAYFIGSLAYLFAIATVGLLVTILFVMCRSALKYAGCHVFLKEKVTVVQIAASIVLIGLSIIVMIVGA